MNKRKMAHVAGILLDAVILGVGGPGGGAVALHAQAPGASAANAAANAGDTVIRSETRVVLVDAVALDKKNNLPRDLTQKDFRIWEDGKEQKITSFSLETAGVSPDRPAKHYSILFFDMYGTNHLRERQDTSQFLDGFASPDRYMSVVESFGGGFRVLQNFSSDPEKLKSALNQLQAGSRGAGAAVGGPNMSAGNFLYRELLNSITNAANSVAAIRGRKALIIYSPGFISNPDLNDYVTTVIEACNKANVAVYSVIPSGPGGGITDASAESTAQPAGGGRGRGAPPPAQVSNQSDPSLNALHTISDETGGFAFLTNADLVNGLGKIAREQESYYLLGYTPAVEAAEGTCHTLKVKVERSGLDVRARRGYCTSRPAGLLTAKPAGQDLEARAASGAANIQAKMQLPWFYVTPYATPNVAEVSIAMDVAPSTMKLQKVKGRLHGEFDLAGVASKPDGSVAGRFNDTVKLDFDTRQQVDAFLKTPYHYVSQFEIAPGQYNFRMVFSSGDQAFAKVDTPLSIAPWNGQVLSMSGIALSHDAHPFTGLQAGVDEALLDGPRPLVAKNTEIVPTGTNQFHAGERAYFYFEVYEPRLSATAATPAAGAPDVGMRIQMLDRATGVQKSDSGVVSAANLIQPGNPVIPVAGTLPPDLPKGAYRMEASVVHHGGQDTVVRTVDFDVN